VRLPVLLVLLLLPSLFAVDPVSRISCVGDSITAGYGISDRSRNWPNTLERLLASRGAEVGNFGVSGATLLKQGNQPYWTEAAFANAGAFAPTLVLIMLGTNDSKPSVWDAHGNEFASDLAAMVTHFRALPSNPVVMLMTPPAVYSDAFSINAANLTNGVIPALRSLAATLSVPVIEIRAATSGHPEWFPDGVHPNVDGMAAIAAAVAAALPPAGSDPGTPPGPGAPQEPETPAGSSGSSGDSSSRGGKRGCGLGEGFSLALGVCAHAFLRPKRACMARAP
jgi:lysophospholipase L1-like esterase